MKIYFSLVNLQYKKTIISIRFIVGLLILFSFYSNELMGLREMSVYFNESIPFYHIAFTLSDNDFLMIYFVSLYLIYSNIPYRDEQQMQILTRTGKKVWLFSYLGVILLISITFIFFLFLFTILFLNTQLNFTNKWGRIIGTLGQQPHFGIPFNIEYDYSYYVQIHLAPFEAFIRTIFFSFAIQCIFGLCMYIGNLLGKNLGTIIGALLIFIHLLSSYIYEFGFYYYSPISWISLTKTQIETVGGLPSILYILTMILIILIIILVLLSYYSSNKIGNQDLL